jgi:predicted O-methyltransferase YrrM
MSMDQYSFTNNWFETGAKNVWDQLIPQVNPTQILEIGSYEGASACYLIDKFSPGKSIEIHCVDTWEGGVENKEGGFAHVDMGDVETRFRQNVQLAKSRAINNVDVVIHKGMSDAVLAGMLAGGKAGYFDFIYVDGSHQAPDVLYDALLAFRLLRVNGLIAFDDYLWQEPLPNGVDPIRCPKPAIDAFTNIYCRKIKIIGAPLYQLYVQKLRD